MPPHHGTSFFLSLFPWNLISMHSYYCITSYHSAAKALERAFSEKSRLFFLPWAFWHFSVSLDLLSLSLSPVEKSLSSPQFRELTHLGFFCSLGDERVYHYWPVTSSTTTTSNEREKERELLRLSVRLYLKISKCSSWQKPGRGGGGEGGEENGSEKGLLASLSLPVVHEHMLFVR